MANNLYQAKKMFKHACAFADCTYSCNVEIKGAPHLTQPLGIPGIVLSAFACEIFLKALLIFLGLPERDVRSYKHHLKRLWEKYKDLDAASAQFFLNVYMSDYSVQAFENELNIVDNNFEEIRYIYEGTNIQTDRTFLKYLCDNLKCFCCQIIHGCSWEQFGKDGCNWL